MKLREEGRKKQKKARKEEMGVLDTTHAWCSAVLIICSQRKVNQWQASIGGGLDNTFSVTLLPSHPFHTKPIAVVHRLNCSDSAPLLLEFKLRADKRQARSQGGSGGSSDPPQNGQIQRDRKIIHA